MPSWHDDPNQLSLDFAAQVDLAAHAAREMLQTAVGQREPVAGRGLETEDELYVEMATACKRAIRESGRSREQILDEVNRYLQRTDGRDDPEHKRPISIHMFDNYLSKPAHTPIRTSITHAICKVTGILAPYEILVADLGGRIIASTEVVELNLGKIQQLTAELARLKRELSRSLCMRSRP